jgi:hypothetical protein
MISFATNTLLIALSAHRLELRCARARRRFARILVAIASIAARAGPAF